MDRLLDTLISRRVSRRKFLASVGAGAGAATALTVAGCGESKKMTTTPPPSTNGVTDTDIFNFALNLEYLESEYYLRGALGSGLTDADAGSGAGQVTGGTQVAFKTPAIQQYALEIAKDELDHVRYIRSALGSSAVSRPAIDLMSSFNAAASAAGIGSNFNPYADEKSFLVGAFVFEDVGVTAYHGVASLLASKDNLAAAAGILAAEAYHAGEIRTLITQFGEPYVGLCNKIANLRAAASGGGETTLSASQIVNADSNAISFDRTTDQVLHIVYLSTMAGVIKSGGFFPNGFNGTISATAS